jgi:hypothetical protein
MIGPIDLCVRGNVTIGDNISGEGIAVKGGVLKSINQFFNNEYASEIRIWRGEITIISPVSIQNANRSNQTQCRRIWNSCFNTRKGKTGL